MYHIKTIVIMVLMTFSFTAFANQSEPTMDLKKTLVLSYDYSQERVLKESSAILHKNSKYNFHGEGNFDVVILGEKQKIVIPKMQESFLFFDENFQEVKLYFEPTNHWLTFPKLVEKITQIKENLKPIKSIAIKADEFDMNKLSEKYFENEVSELIAEYELEHYKIFFIAKKLDTPKEIHPRDRDVFQLIVRVETKKHI